eukprot:g3986.t1
MFGTTSEITPAENLKKEEQQKQVEKNSSSTVPSSSGKQPATKGENEDGESKCGNWLIGNFGFLCCGLCKKVKHERGTGSQFLEKQERKCTDCFCLVVFLLVMLLWFFVGMFAAHTGEPRKLIYGTDSTGELCSAGMNVGKDYLYYPRLNEDLLASLADLGTDWEGLQDSILTGGLDVMNKIKLTGVCVERCPYEGEVVCTRPYLEKNGAIEPSDLDNYGDVDRCKSETTFSFLNDEFCSSCWTVPLNTTHVFHRCLEIVLSKKFEDDRCVNPKYDPDRPLEPMLASDPRCLTKETTYTEIERKSAYPNPIAEYLGEAVETLGSFVADAERTMGVILVCGIVFALVVGFVWLLVLQKYVGYIVWGTIWAYLGVIGFSAMFMSYKAGFFEGVDEYARGFFHEQNATADGDLDDTSNVTSSFFDDVLSTFETSPEDSSSTMYKVAAFLLVSLEAVSVCLVISWKKKIEIMIAVIKESTKAIMKMPFLSILPWFTTAQVLVVSVVALGMTVTIQTIDTDHEFYKFVKEAAESSAQGLICENSTITNTTMTGTDDPVVVSSCTDDLWMPSDSDFISALQLFHLFCYLWVNQLILAIGCCGIAGAVCRWYWTRPRVSKKKFLGYFPILSSYYRVFRYHLGSLAMGSFFIALVQVIRFIMEYVNKRTRKLQEKHRIVRYLMSVVRCVLWCFEKSLKYLTSSAYILIAMKGVSFCKAAKLSFFIIYHNMVQLAIVAMMTKVVVFIGKVLIVAICSLFAYGYISTAAAFQPGGDEELGSYIFPTVLVALLSYFVAQSFLQVFSLTIQTIMICFIEDREANKDNPRESYYPENLYKVMVPKTERREEELACAIAERDKSEYAIYPKGRGPLTDEEKEAI